MRRRLKRCISSIHVVWPACCMIFQSLCRICAGLGHAPSTATHNRHGETLRRPYLHGMPGWYVIFPPMACVSLLKIHERVSSAVATLLLVSDPFIHWTTRPIIISANSWPGMKVLKLSGAVVWVLLLKLKRYSTLHAIVHCVVCVCYHILWSCLVRKCRRVNMLWCHIWEWNLTLFYTGTTMTWSWVWIWHLHGCGGSGLIHSRGTLYSESGLFVPEFRWRKGLLDSDCRYLFRFLGGA